MNDNTYMIDQVDIDCFDLYVSDDGGYTWEHYATYDEYNAAKEDGKSLVLLAGGDPLRI